MAKEPLYSDLDPELKIDYGGNILVLKDQKAINASIDNLLGITRGELVMQPTVGCSLEDFVGGAADDNSAQIVEMIITEALDQDPRVLADELTVEPVPDDAELKVLLQYRLDVSYIRAEFERIVELG